jgi:PAS domain S-box-containing protein
MSVKTKEKDHIEIDERTLQTLPVAVMLYDARYIYFANKKACSILGVSAVEPEQHSVFSFLDPSIHPEIKKYIKEALSDKKVHKRELEMRNFKGKMLLIESESTCVTYKGKKVLECVFSEVLESRTAERESRSAQELLQKISANSQDVIFHFGFEQQMQLKFISDSAFKTLGFTPSEIYKNPSLLKTHLHKDDRHLLVITKEDYLKQKAATRKRKIVVRFKRKDGVFRHLEIAVNPVNDSRRELAGLICNMRDITDRIETDHLLLETKKKFDLITNNANDIICFYTYYPKEQYLYVSPNILKILGFVPEDLLNDTYFFRRRLAGENKDYHEAERLMKQYQRDNTIKNLHYSFKILNKNGEELWLENNLVPITGDNGRISFFINILRDITEQKESDLEIETQYNNYRNLLDNSPVAYLIHDHGTCLYVNKALMQIVKAKNKNQVVGKFVLDFFEEPDRYRAMQRMKSIYEDPKQKARFFNYNLRDLQGERIELEIKSVSIKFNERDCILSLVNSLDEQRQREREKIRVLITETANKQLQKEIREREEAERSLTEKTAQLSSIFESSTHLIWTVNDRYEVTSFNQNFASVVKNQHGVDIKPGDLIDALLKRNRKEYIQFWYGKYAEAFKGKKLEFVKEDFVNRPLYRKIFINPIYNSNNAVSEISCIANDITDSKIYEQKLIQQTGKLSAIFDSSHHYIWTIDREGKLTSFNKNYYELVTALYNTKPFLGLVLNRGVLANDREYTDMLQYHYDKAFKGLATSFEIQTRDKEMKNVYLEIFFNPIIENGVVVEVSGIAHNTTEKKHVQQRMEQSLKEKEVLLREVHHRVKNNMQVISSILNLQSSYVSDEYTLQLLKESQNRIKTMAYIHESLYQNKSFTSVNFSEYVNTLVNNIVQSYAYNSEKVRLALEIERVNLSLDSSIPAGLIINELITNSIKHAFPGARQGQIDFTLRTENNYVFLEIKDDGVGFAPEVDFENSHSLGLQLVNTLIEQIEGKLTFNSEQGRGTEVIVTFKM